ncbi:hypothetical protein GCM10009092_23680 [Bowmanella denitrificans]|uniref:Uncharacterized protein n=1 Tax=Bowmanella denitrificans TaxID=366582 RepID=A0ABN0X9K9_9ALTE|nr:hypothetical protein [Bowmanella denitrificans]
MINENTDFLSLKIRKDVLEKLISHHQLHVEDLRCGDSQSAAALKRLLIDCTNMNVSAN